MVILGLALGKNLPEDQPKLVTRHLSRMEPPECSVFGVRHKTTYALKDFPLLSALPAAPCPPRTPRCHSAPDA